MKRKVSDARVQPIFNDALDKPAGAERENYLVKICGGDSVLRGRIDALLRAHDQAGAFLAERDLNTQSPSS